jgi:peptide chain release factor 1
MKIDKNKYKIEYTRGTGAGGQHRNKVETCVVITHLATGMQEKCEDQRSRAQNEKIAFERLKARLKERMTNIKLIALNDKRREAIQSVGRIRTYNFQRNEVKDHRTGKIAPLDKVLNGEIELLNE